MTDHPMPRAAHPMLRHRDGITCVWIASTTPDQPLDFSDQRDDGVWFVPYDAGGEGHDCHHPEHEELARAQADPSPAHYVREFHETYGVVIRDTPTARIPEAVLREDLIEEEVDEYREASRAGDIVEIADGLADIVYIAYGTALAHGIPLDAVLAEVHRANMSKLDSDGKPIYRADGKVLKGPDYSPPDVAAVLARGAQQ